MGLNGILNLLSDYESRVNLARHLGIKTAKPCFHFLQAGLTFHNLNLIFFFCFSVDRTANCLHFIQFQYVSNQNLRYFHSDCWRHRASCCSAHAVPSSGWVKQRWLTSNSKSAITVSIYIYVFSDLDCLWLCNGIPIVTRLTPIFFSISKESIPMVDTMLEMINTMIPHLSIGEYKFNGHWYSS